jgi:hypothetical protein
MVARALAVAVALSLSSACQRQSSCVQVSSTAASEFRTLVYTRAFADRFRLPDQGVYALDPGLEALALHIGLDEHLNGVCQVDLYLDDDVAFSYPSGSAGREVDTTARGAMFFVDELNAEDSRARRERWSGGDPILVRSVEVDYDKHKGSFGSARPRAFERNILPGLSYLSFDIVCFALNPDNVPLQVWLRREGHTKTIEITPTTEEAYAFSIPNALIAHASGAIRAALSAPVHLEPEKHHPPAYSLPPRQAAGAHTTP